MIVNGVNVGYTDNGNVYRKSDTGKNVGTTLATTGTVAGGIYGLNKFAKTNIIKIPDYKVVESMKYLKVPGNIKDFVNLVKQFIIDPKAIKPEQWFRNPSALDKASSNFAHSKIGQIISPITRTLSKTKLGRLCLVVSAVTIPVGVAALVGKGIGAVYDKIVNHSAKKQADFQANL